MKHKNYALVLAGGGAKGAYQIGAWKAFRETKVKFDCILGVSVGALNGALMVQNLFQEAIDIWQNMSIEKIIYLPDGVAEDIKSGRLNVFSPSFLKVISHVWNEVKRHGGFDSTPLYNLIEKYVDEKKIRKNKKDFGLVTYRLTDFTPQVLFLEDIPYGMLSKFLLASASLPGFKPTKIFGKDFIDGGVYNNIPLRLVKERGYRRVIVVDISGIGMTETPDFTNMEVIYIKNSIDFGGILDFRPSFISSFMELGYLDTLKVFQKVDGIYYFYHPAERLISRIEKLFYSQEVQKKLFAILTERKSKQLTYKDSVRSILPERLKNFKFLSVAIIEQSARYLNLPIVKLYNLEDLILETFNILKKKLAENPSLLDYKPKNIFEEIINNQLLQNTVILKMFYILTLEAIKKKVIKHSKNFS